jgi:hypothetical protein
VGDIDCCQYGATADGRVRQGIVRMGALLPRCLTKRAINVNGRKRAWGIRAIVFVGVIFLLFWIYGKQWRSSLNRFDQEAIARDKPVDIGPRTRFVMSLSLGERRWLFEQVQPQTTGKMGAAYCYHILRLHGPKATFNHGIFKTGRDLLSLLTDAEAGRSYYGSPTIIATRSGLRFPTKRGVGNVASEFHRDQCLATLAEIGIPLSFPVVVGGDRFCVKDVLQDSTENFHLRQEELAWTALAYTRYLPPKREWQNRFGERFSFHDLALALLERPLSQESCSGTHLLMALTVLLRADTQMGILSSEARVRVRQWLQRCLRTAIRTQMNDGTWRSDWHRTLLTDPLPWNYRKGDDDVTILLITGHLSEWMLYLPEDLEVPDDVFNRAGSWLLTQLKKASPKEQEKFVCPYSHAAYVLRNISFSP